MVAIPQPVLEPPAPLIEYAVAEAEHALSSASESSPNILMLGDAFCARANSDADKESAALPNEAMVATPQPVLDATICVAKTDCCAASAVLAAAVSLRIARALGFAFLVLATDAEDPGTATADEALSQLVLNGNRRAFESATWPLVCDALKPPAE